MIYDMAKSKKSNRMKFKGYPTHRFLRYKLSHNGTGQDNHYIDLARDISALNFRKYEQGRVWGVSSFTLHDMQSRVHAQIAGLRHNWPTYSAYRLARRIWRKQQLAIKSNVGAWQQFIVALSRDQITDADCLLPLDTEDMSALRGEWMLSQLSYNTETSASDAESNAGIVMTGSTNNSTALQFGGATPSGGQLTGGDSNVTGPMYVRNTSSGTSASWSAPGFSGTISAMDEWQKMRPDQTNIPDADADSVDSVFAHMLQQVDSMAGSKSYEDDILERTEEEGDHPPYCQDLAGLDDSGTNDGLWIYREARFATGQKTIMMPGAEIPLGLIKVVTNSETSGDTMYLDIEVAPGGYKGVHALEI